MIHSMFFDQDSPLRQRYRFDKHLVHSKAAIKRNNVSHIACLECSIRTNRLQKLKKKLNILKKQHRLGAFESPAKSDLPVVIPVPESKCGWCDPAKNIATKDETFDENGLMKKRTTTKRRKEGSYLIVGETNNIFFRSVGYSLVG